MIYKSKRRLNASVLLIKIAGGDMAFKILTNTLHNGIEYQKGEIIEDIDKILIKNNLAKEIKKEEKEKRRKRK